MNLRGKRLPEIERALKGKVAPMQNFSYLKRNAQIQRENIYRAVENKGIKRHNAEEFIRGNAIKNLRRMELNPQKLADAAQDVNDAMYKSGGRIEVFVERCEAISNKYANEALREKQRLKRL